MPKSTEKLAASLTELHNLQQRGLTAIHTDDISKASRMRLVQQGFLKEVVRGWYIPARPDERPGDSTSWYTNYWDFCARYLESRYVTEWIVTADHSLQWHAGNHAVPAQLMIKAPTASNFKTDLLHHTSIFHLQGSLPPEEHRTLIKETRLFTLPAALVNCSASVFTQAETDARTALALIRNASDVLGILLEGGHSTIAGRLAGAFRNMGQERIADDISGAMRAAGYEIREADPFETQLTAELSFRDRSPFANRIRLLWQQMREKVLRVFPPVPGIPNNKAAYLKSIEDIYITDAYHSLSIERYQVTPELIERVRTGEWNIQANPNDAAQRNAMAARGYWQAFQVVENSIRRILDGANPGTVLDDDHASWYRELFSPSVAVGVLRPADLAGYRNHQVYIGGSKHVPVNVEGVRDTMPLLFELLENEPEASVRAVLGHFIFVYIHPYMDGNGRMGRFLMNAMLASGGYPWTVIPVEQRDTYMHTLEAASVTGDITEFAEFIAGLVRSGLEGNPVAAILPDINR
ncbi:MAG: Fic family protein [Sphingobacteriales bacterium]